MPGGAVTARRWPAPRHPAGTLHAFGPVSALACGQRSCPCSPLCSGFPLPVPLQLRRSWRCRGLGRSSPRGCQRPRRNSVCSFVTSSGRNSLSSRIGEYNTFVQNRAAAGHTLIRPFSTKFRVVGSTPTVHARDNTGTTYTAPDKGPPIWWLNGSKAADNYQDFYDGSWDSESGRNESGNGQTTGCGNRGIGGVWTGSNNNGTTKGGTSFGGSTNSGTIGGLNCSSLNPLSSNTSLQHVARKINSTPCRPSSSYSTRLRFRASRSRRLQRTPPRAMPRTRPSRCGSISARPCRLRARPTWCSTSAGRRAARPTRPAPARAISTSNTRCRRGTSTRTVSRSAQTVAIDRGCGRISLGGGRISAQSDGLAAELDLPALGNQSDHKVDGMPNFTPNPGVGPMANPGAGEVALNWALTPPGLVRPGSFRLLFVTSSRNATSAAIADYNNHAINDAGAGHSAIRGFKNGFRVIASTETVDARDNAGLTGTGVKIYWMGSNNRVADDYADCSTARGTPRARPTRTGAPRRSRIGLDRLGR